MTGWLISRDAEKEEPSTEGHRQEKDYEESIIS